MNRVLEPRSSIMLFALPALLMAALTLAAPRASAQNSTGDVADFPPLNQWKAAVIAGDAAQLIALYSVDPPAQVQANGANTSAEADVTFWLGLKARSMSLEMVRVKQRPNAESVIFKAEVLGADGRTVNVTDAQGWRNLGGAWRLVGAERTDAPRLKQPADMKKDIYPVGADARAEIDAAEKEAASRHKRVLLVFGANWCYDCHVLDLAFHRPDLAPVLAQGYELVHVDLGDDGKKNSDLARQFDTPLDKGIPVLAVIESDGKVVVSQKNGEFEDARSLTPEALLEFLNQWKPQAR